MYGCSIYGIAGGVAPAVLRTLHSPWREGCYSEAVFTSTCGKLSASDLLIRHTGCQEARADCMLDFPVQMHSREYAEVYLYKRGELRSQSLKTSIHLAGQQQQQEYVSQQFNKILTH